MTDFEKSTGNQSGMTQAVKNFWNDNPLCVDGNPNVPGTKEFFAFYDLEREKIESPQFSNYIHEYSEFTDKKVLDIGSGNGYVLAEYARRGAEVHGVDITEAAVDLCNARFDQEGLIGNFRVADAQALPFEDNFFDCVCSMGVLHHVPETQKALLEAKRVLKPGGKLILMFYHRNSAKYHWKYRVWSLFTRKSMQQLVNEFDGVGNPKGEAYTKAELRSLLSDMDNLHLEVGFLETKDVLLRGARYFPDNLFSWLAPWLGWNLYAKSTKRRTK